MIKSTRTTYNLRIENKFLKRKKREKKLAELQKGFEKYKKDVRRNNPDCSFKNYPFYRFRQKCFLLPKPKHSELILYLLEKGNAFGKKNLMFESNIFEMPNPFSLIDNYKETSRFLKKLFNALYFQSFENMYIDYSKCEHIDVGASMCMDIILSDFIKYYHQLQRDKHTVKVDEIKPINYERYSIEKVLFSIGAFRSIKGFKINYENITDFPIIIGNKKNKKLSIQREIDITNTVDYIINCLSQMNKTLTGTAETNLYKVIGEVIQNADEHSNTNDRYSIGYFERTQTTNGHFGIFNLAILNFGNTIYETFTNPECQNEKVVNQMKELSKKYTSRKLFRPSDFEEETLWTLYALQDGVTRMPDWERGNGAIRFIESFFKLKGNEEVDEISKMVITSGHTRVIFDGKYNIVSKQRGNNSSLYKMMTFNQSGDIEDKPDSQYVKFEKNYFPGTMISVKIKIDYDNTENLENERN